MKATRIFSIVIGLFIIYIGLTILLHNLGISFFKPKSIFPIILLLIGYFLLKKQKKIAGYVFVTIGAIIFLDEWLGIDLGDIIGFALAIFFISVGVKIIRKRKGNLPQPQQQQQPSQTSEEDAPNSEDKEPDQEFIFKTPDKKHSLIGNCFYTGSRWELRDLDIWHGIGEVKLDLSRANIPNQKTTIIINGWIGDVDIYVPYDLDVSIITQLGVGDVDIFGNKEGGLNKTITLETKNYRNSVRRVEIVVHLLVGDIDIAYL